MNNLVGIVFGLVVFIMIVAFVVGFMELAVPLIVKADFDRTCDQYLDRAYEKGGLTNSDITEFTTALQNLSPKLTVLNVNVSLVGSVPYKGNIVFDVDAVYTNSSFASLLVRQNKTYNMSFFKQVANKIIIN